VGMLILQLIEKCLFNLLPGLFNVYSLVLKLFRSHNMFICCTIMPVYFQLSIKYDQISICGMKSS
jgi:hypothetical protein